MTQEDKELLLKDLCARLPYGIKCQIDYDNEEDADLGIERYCDDRIVSVCVETEEIGLYEASEYFYPDEIKPYLRPMSSMTEKEKKEMLAIFESPCENPRLEVDKYCGITYTKYAESHRVIDMYYDAEQQAEWLDWLNSHHFDYRGLISKGLAIEAPEGMY